MKLINAKLLLALVISQFIVFTQLSAIEFRAGSATGATSTQVIIPVRVFDFDSLLSCQGSVQFDVSVVNYNTIQQFGLPGMTLANFGLSQVGVGNLSYLWDDGTLTGVSVADSTIIFEIVFDVVGTAGEQSTICFGDVPTGREVIDINFNTVNPTYTCGSVQVPGGSTPVATLTVTDVTCFGASDGTASVSALGGATPYSYSWSTGATTQSVTGLPPGPISVTVTDGNSATDSASDTIIQPSSALSITGITSTPETGCGASDGTASATVSGGTPSYTYSWSSGGTGPTITGLIGGAYTLTVTDSKGCSDTDNVTVGSSSSSLTATISSTNVGCFGDSTGSATVTAASGQAPYSYSWSNGSASATISGLAAGTYSVTVEDQNNCAASASVTITEPSQLTLSTTSTDISCFNAADGSASVNASGGTGTPTYSWSTGATTSSITSQGPGSPGVTVTDANSCTATSSVTFTNPPQITATASLVSAVSCFGGSNGSAVVTASGGTPTYTYLWTGGSTSASPNNLTSGDKTVTVTDDNGCTATASVNVTQPSAALTASATATDATTAGGSDGAVALTVSGGTVSYSYSWSNGATTEDISNLTAATYSVTVTDANSCTATASATVDDGPISVFDLKTVENIKVFPNPNNGNFEVEINSGEQLTELKVLYQLGQVVYSMDLSNSAYLDNRISVKTELLKGIYIVQLVTRDNSLKTGTLSVEY